MNRQSALLSIDTPIRLSAGAHSALIAPQAGGRVLSLSSERRGGSGGGGGSDGSGGQTHQWLTPITARQWSNSEWPKGGCYPLVPFSNRVRGARFTFDDAEHQLATFDGQAHALHGYGQYVAWQVDACSNDAVTMSYTHRGGDSGWPWAFHATQTLRLDPDGLTLAMRLRNLSANAMPAGFGFHPYFSADQASLSADWRWPHDSEEIALRREPAVARERIHDRTAEGDTEYCSGWDGRARLAWHNGAHLEMVAHPVFDHLVVHCAPGRDYLCLEPVTHVSDAFNLAHAGVPATGLQRLAPQQDMQGQLTLRLQPN